jgi:hypothetical protein
LYAKFVLLEFEFVDEVDDDDDVVEEIEDGDDVEPIDFIILAGTNHLSLIIKEFIKNSFKLGLNYNLNHKHRGFKVKLGRNFFYIKFISFEK